MVKFEYCINNDIPQHSPYKEVECGRVDISTVLELSYLPPLGGIKFYMWMGRLFTIVFQKV